MAAVKAECNGASGPMESGLGIVGGSAGIVESSLSVRIHNLDEIGRVYGSGAALAASDHVRELLKYRLRDRESLGSAEYVLRQLSENPVAHDGQRFHLFVSLAPTGDTKDCAYKVMPTVHGNPAFPDDAWCRHYRADMALAVNLFDAMRDGRLMPAWQAIRSADDPSEVLYHECLMRILTPEGVIEPAGDAIEAIERLGLVRALDRFVAEGAIDALRGDRIRRIGINMSAQSLECDIWWARLTKELESDPQLAARLYVEITETAPMTSASHAIELVSVLRGCGCHIVVDDFGVGHASIRQLLAFKPEVVKIDRFFVHFAKASAQGFAALCHLVGLAESLGSLPVLEGIETADESEIASKAGCSWQQGYHHGRPSFTRPQGIAGFAGPGLRDAVLGPGGIELGAAGGNHRPTPSTAMRASIEFQRKAV
jgi:EAL domain-containing protein (putative c-di-GMP-specific phosphodiesterase class I)